MTVNNTNTLALSSWFTGLDKVYKLGIQRQVAHLTGLKCLSLLTLISAFYYFSQVMHNWVVKQQAAERQTLLLLAASLACCWLLQGVVNTLSLVYKANLLRSLEQQLHMTFTRQQHALIRQQTTFYWQRLWLHHIQSLSHWAFDYRPQQQVAVIMPLVTLVIIFYINAMIGVGLAVSLPVVPVFMIILGKGAAALHRKHFIALERLGGIFTDRLNALPMLASFRAHRAQTQLLQDASQKLNQRTMGILSIAFLSSSVLDFFATLAVALAAVFIGFTLLGELNIGPAISLQQGLWMLLTLPLLLSEMKKLGLVYHQKAQADAARTALQPLFDLSLQPAACLSVKGQADVFQGFSVKNFLLPGLLSAANLCIQPGERIRICGHSGSGKTLLLEALAGHRQANAQLAGKHLWLTQQPVILPWSVRDNLCLDDNYRDDKLTHILKLVELLPWLQALPHGLDSKMGSSAPMSGGEAQRFALARALLRDAQIWLLDEPTAHLPTQQHHRLSALIERLSADKTLLWVSHKPLPHSWFSQTWQVSKGKVINQVATKANHAAQS